MSSTKQGLLFIEDLRASTKRHTIQNIDPSALFITPSVLQMRIIAMVILV